MTTKDEFKRELDVAKNEYVEKIVKSEQEKEDRQKLITREARELIYQISQENEKRLKEFLINEFKRAKSNRIVLEIEFVKMQSYHLKLRINKEELILSNNKQDLDKISLLEEISGRRVLKRMLNEEFTRIIRAYGLFAITDRWLKFPILTMYIFNKTMLVKKVFIDFFSMLLQVVVLSGILWIIAHVMHFASEPEVETALGTEFVRSLTFHEFFLKEYTFLTSTLTFFNVVLCLVWLLFTSEIHYKRTNFSIERAMVASIIVELLIFLVKF
jgi:hypothetical protein